MSNTIKITYGGGKELELNAKPILSLEEMNILVQDALSLVFNDEGGYYPQYLEFGKNSALLVHYADLEMPEDLNEAYEICCLTDATEQLCKVVNQTQYAQIISAVDELYAFRKSKAVRYSPLSKLLEGLEDVAENMKGMDLSGIMDIAGKLGGMDEQQIVDAVIDHKVKTGEIMPE